MVNGTGLIVIAVIFVLSAILLITLVKAFDGLREDCADKIRILTMSFFSEIEDLEKDKARYMKLYNELLSENMKLQDEVSRRLKNESC